MGFYRPIVFKDNLRTIEPQFPKNLRTNEARSDFTSPNKKKCRDGVSADYVVPTPTMHRFFGWSVGDAFVDIKEFRNF